MATDKTCTSTYPQHYCVFAFALRNQGLSIFEFRPGYDEAVDDDEDEAGEEDEDDEAGEEDEDDAADEEDEEDEADEEDVEH